MSIPEFSSPEASAVNSSLQRLITTARATNHPGYGELYASDFASLSMGEPLFTPEGKEVNPIIGGQLTLDQDSSEIAALLGNETTITAQKIGEEIVGAIQSDLRIDRGVSQERLEDFLHGPVYTASFSLIASSEDKVTGQESTAVLDLGMPSGQVDAIEIHLSHNYGLDMLTHKQTMREKLQLFEAFIGGDGLADPMLALGPDQMIEDFQIRGERYADTEYAGKRLATIAQ